MKFIKDWFSRPIFTFLIIQVIMPPTVSPSFLIFLIKSSIPKPSFGLDNEQVFSMRDKSTSDGLVLNDNGPTAET